MSWQSWGVSPKGILHGNVNECVYCRYDSSFEPGGGNGYIVGFSNDKQYLQHQPSYKIGAQVYKCPKCQRLTWCHCYDSTQLLIESDRESDRWRFYWPEAEAAYQAMVAERDNK